MDLEKELLETRYFRDKKDTKLMFYISLITPFLLPIFLILYFMLWAYQKKQFEYIRKLRDEENEKELLQIVQKKRYGLKCIYALYALVDLNNNQIKELVIEKIMQINNQPLRSSFTLQILQDLGVVLAWINKKELEKDGEGEKTF